MHAEIRWFCLKETYVSYLYNQHRLCFAILVDMDFSIKKGIKTGLIHGISIKNSQRSLLVKCQNAREITYLTGDCIGSNK